MGRRFFRRRETESELLEIPHQGGDLLKITGEKFPALVASVQGDAIYMGVGKAAIEPDDLIIRTPSNGVREVYRVIDPGFHEAHFGIPANYQIKARRLCPSDAATSIASVGSDPISTERRDALFSQWEDLGLETVKQDLANGGFKFIGGPPATRQLAREWVRRKEAERPSGGHTFQTSGPNSRINIGSNEDKDAIVRALAGALAGVVREFGTTSSP